MSVTSILLVGSVLILPHHWPGGDRPLTYEEVLSQCEQMNVIAARYNLPPTDCRALFGPYYQRAEPSR